MTTSAEQLLDILSPLTRAYGRSPLTGKIKSNGKHEAKSWTEKPTGGHEQLLSVEVMERHLEKDSNAIGIFPLRDDNRCKFGVIDIDDYDDPDELRINIVRKHIPFITCRSKSGGIHLYWIVPEPIAAKKMRAVLSEWVYALGLPPKTEIFPKSDTLEKGDGFGNFINLFLAGIRAGKTDRAVLNVNGKPFTDETAALEYIKTKVTVLRSPIASDGPPCIQRAAVDGQGEGGRNNLLFNFAVYAHKKYQDDFDDHVDTFNRTALNPPLRSREVASIIMSVSKREYHYICEAEPCKSLCDRSNCLTQTYGVARTSVDDDVEHEVILPSHQLAARDAAANIYPRLAAANLCFLRGDAVVEILEDRIKPISSQMFRSVLEALGTTYSINRANQANAVVKQRRSVSNDIAQELLACPVKRDYLSPLNLVLKLPLMKPDGSIMSPGYNVGGVYVTDSCVVPVVPYEEAVDSLLGLFDDFDFVTPADRSRNFAMIVTAGLRMSGLIVAPVPIDYSEADQSQAGKTLRQAAIRFIYGCDDVPIVPRKQQGTGSFDETLGEHLYKGHAFAPMDNVRGKVESELIEALATAPSGIVTVRLPYTGSVEINVPRASLQISSNGVNMTPDLANRCCIVRIRKRPSGSSFRHDDLLSHIRENRGKYLGCALAIIRDWIDRGRPRRETGEHDMRIWDRTLSDIVERAGLPPMMTGHQEIKQRTISPVMNWLRLVTFHMKPGKGYTASELLEISEANEIDVPVRPGERMAMIIGRKLAPLFSDEIPTIDIDGLKITREIRRYQKTDAVGNVTGSGEMKVYRREFDVDQVDEPLPY